MLRQGLLVFLSIGLLLQGGNAEISCKECKLLVTAIHSLWGSDTIENCLSALVAAVCTMLHLEDHYICEGIAKEFKDEADWVLGQIILEPKQLCGLLLEDEGCGDFVNPLHQNWSLTLPGDKPEHVEPQPPIQFNKPTLRVLHLSDLHIDRKYTIGLEAKCSEPQCCRPLSDPDEVSITADEPQEPAGKWGTEGTCDSPYWLFTNMMDHIAAVHKDIDYVVVSGDLESHADWDYTRERHQEMVKNSSDTIRARMKNTPVFFCVGNHEGVPIDNFAPHFTPDRFHMDWLYGTMAEAWGNWIPSDQVQTVWYNACYMRKLFPGLRIISLNNGLGDSKNFFLLVNATDPDGTLTWLVNQLTDAEKAGDKVHLVAHIPGGSGEMLESWAINFYRIVNRFEDTIVAQFMGHEHSEEYNMYYEDPDDAKSRPTGVSFSAPSLTTYSEYWPAYRIYTIEGNYTGSLYRVVDWEEYYLNLTEANASDDDPVWKQLYASVLDTYGLNDASAGEWSRLIDRMRTDDKLFNKYRFNYYRHEPEGTCNAACKTGFLCSARKSHHGDDICKDLNGKKSTTKSESHKKANKKSKTRKGSANLRKNLKIDTLEDALIRVKAYSKMRALKSNQFDDDKCKLPTTTRMGKDKEKIRINAILLGDVNSGRATLAGHLVHKCVDQRTVERLEQEAKNEGIRECNKFTWTLEKLKAECERGEDDSDLSLLMFNTARYLVTFIDAPGHRDFCKNLIRGSTRAHCAVLVVSAIQSEFEKGMTGSSHSVDGQAQEGLTVHHIRLARALRSDVGIKHLIVAVNKMDATSPPYCQARFIAIKEELSKVLEQHGFDASSIPFVPVSARNGDNLSDASAEMPWTIKKWEMYHGRDGKAEGRTLVDAFDALPPLRLPSDRPLRLPIQDVYKVGGLGTVPTGRVESGTLKAGMLVTFVPEHLTTTVTSLEMVGYPEAGPGEQAYFSLKGVEKSAISRGSVCCETNNDPAREARSFVAQVVILNRPCKVEAGYSAVLECHTARVPCKVTELKQKLCRRTGRPIQESPKSLKTGDCAVIEIHPLEPICVEQFNEYSGLGRFRLREEGRVVIVGVIEVVEKVAMLGPNKGKKSKMMLTVLLVYVCLSSFAHAYVEAPKTKIIIPGVLKDGRKLADEEMLWIVRVSREMLHSKGTWSEAAAAIAAKIRAHVGPNLGTWQVIIGQGDMAFSLKDEPPLVFTIDTAKIYIYASWENEDDRHSGDDVPQLSERDDRIIRNIGKRMLLSYDWDDATFDNTKKFKYDAAFSIRAELEAQLPYTGQWNVYWNCILSRGSIEYSISYLEDMKLEFAVGNTTVLVYRAPN